MTTMHMPGVKTGWHFWLEWMGVDVGAIVLYLILMIPLNVAFSMLRPAVPDEPMNMWLSVSVAAIGSLSLGAVLGAAQWLVLRRYLQRAGGWVLATTIGYGLPLLFPFGLGQSMPGPLMGMVAPVGFGVALGLLQWLVLRGRVRNAAWWILVSIGGWLLAFALTDAAYVMNLYVEPFDMFSAAFVPIAVAGVGLGWLLHEG